MLETLTAEQKEVFFEAAPSPDEVWLGDIFHVDEHFEVVPFQLKHRYLAVFYHPIVAIGDLADDPEFVGPWSGGYQPAKNARLVKFGREDATENYYSPEVWQLDNPHQIFQFSELLAEMMLAHYMSVKPQEYFYWPADKRLARMYGRIARQLLAACPDLGYAPILPGTAGEFNGYRIP